MEALQTTFKEHLIDFVFYCRARQFVLSPQQTLEAFEITEKHFLTHRKTFQYALKSIFCKSKEHADRFDEMFDRFWSRFYKEELEQRPFQLKAQEKKSESASLIFMGATFPNPNKQKEEEAKKTTGANATTLLRETDFSKIAAADKEQLEELAEALFHEMSLRFKRRLKKSKSGRINIQKTIRKSLSKGGLMLDLAYKKKAKEKRKVVFLLDVSGSMDTYSFYLLRYILVLKKYFKSLEFFSFSTRLTHVTPLLRTNDESAIYKAIGRHVKGWSSGTKIGASLKEFCDLYGHKFLSQKHIVVILSDGLETGNVSDLQTAVKTIQKRCKSLIWLNPLKGMTNYQPIQKGIINVMPHLDRFETAHNLNSLLKLEKILMNV